MKEDETDTRQEDVYLAEEAREFLSFAHDKAISISDTDNHDVATAVLDIENSMRSLKKFQETITRDLEAEWAKEWSEAHMVE